MELHSSEKLLKQSLYLNLSTVCEDGRPWGTPVFFVYDPDRMELYWWSPKNSQHSRNIKLNRRCFITIFDSHDKEGNGDGLYFEARAEELIKSEEIERGIALYNKKSKAFSLSLGMCSEEAPTRIYKAKIISSWRNKDCYDENGNFYDSRVELSLS
jgi:uncharacterized protein YhbP (UPF0306 family)